MWPECQAGLHPMLTVPPALVRPGRVDQARRRPLRTIRGMPARRVLFAIAALVAVRVVVVPLLLHDPMTTKHNAMLTGDVRRYQRIAQSPGIPWRDFAVEYPPVTWAAIKVLDGRSEHGSATRVAWSQLVCDVAVAAALAYGWRKEAALAYLVLGLPLVVFPFIYLRLDLLSVALAVWGLALVRRDKPVAGGITLAVSCFAKFWPVGIVPLLVLQRRWRALVVTVATGTVGLVAWVAVAGTDGVNQVLSFRGARGWQIESVVGALVRGVTHDVVGVESGAWRVGASAVSWSRPLGAVLAVAVLAVWALAWRHRDEPRMVEAVAPIAAVAAFLAFSPILSPQYVCWLLPFGALAAVEGVPSLARMVGAVVALSAMLLYLIKEVIWGEDGAMAMLLVRNGLVVALFVVGLVMLARRRSEAAAAATPVPHRPAEQALRLPS